MTDNQCSMIASGCLIFVKPARAAVQAGGDDFFGEFQTRIFGS
jgi:hypothetical protein